MWIDDVEVDPDTLLDDSMAPDKSWELQQTIQKVHEVFQLLFRVTVLHAIEERDLAEIAKDMNLRRSTVNRAWEQAKAILKEHL